ncbi:hypothetical protein BC941DRAFT_465816 [Chlamydoabsidia padenii]|nr:hypothetical protein BC941DRAFT_465816 [Chlamydoabsidia padenii]
MNMYDHWVGDIVSIANDGHPRHVLFDSYFTKSGETFGQCCDVMFMNNGTWYVEIAPLKLVKVSFHLSTNTRICSLDVIPFLTVGVHAIKSKLRPLSCLLTTHWATYPNNLTNLMVGSFEERSRRENAHFIGAVAGSQALSAMEHGASNCARSQDAGKWNAGRPLFSGDIDDYIKRVDVAVRELTTTLYAYDSSFADERSPFSMKPKVQTTSYWYSQVYLCLEGVLDIDLRDYI